MRFEILLSVATMIALIFSYNTPILNVGGALYEMLKSLLIVRFHQTVHPGATTIWLESTTNIYIPTTFYLTSITQCAIIIT
jgi:hypothetical protein